VPLLLLIALLLLLARRNSTKRTLQPVSQVQGWHLGFRPAILQPGRRCGGRARFCLPCQSCACALYHAHANNLAHVSFLNSESLTSNLTYMVALSVDSERIGDPTRYIVCRWRRELQQLRRQPQPEHRWIAVHHRMYNICPEPGPPWLIVRFRLNPSTNPARSACHVDDCAGKEVAITPCRVRPGMRAADGGPTIGSGSS